MAGLEDYTQGIYGTVAITGPVTVTGAVTVTGTVAVTGTVTVTGTVAVSGTVTVAGSVTVSGTVAVSGTVTVTGSVTVTGTVSISGTVVIQGAAGGVAVNIQGVEGGTAVAISGSVTVSGTVSISGTVTVSGSVTVSGTVSISGTVTVSGTVAVSGTVTVSGSVTVSGTVAISGTVSISGSVTVTGTVTITGAVTITSGAVTITTSGGANIIIDKLNQTAYAERRTETTITYSNNGDTPVWGHDDAHDYIKLFPQLCMGWIESIDVYAKGPVSGTASITVELRYSPNGPKVLGPYTINLAEGEAAGWKSVNVRKWWSYNSLAIFFHLYGWTLISYGNDTPCDGYSCSTGTEAWITQYLRSWVRVNFAGLGAGVLPVCGTLNVIPIPNTATSGDETPLTAAAKATAYMPIVYGAGEVLFAMWYLYLNSDTSLSPRFEVDGVPVTPGFSMEGWYYHLGRGEGRGAGLVIGTWDATNHNYALLCNLRIPFQKSFRLGFYNPAVESRIMYVTSIYTLIK